MTSELAVRFLELPHSGGALVKTRHQRPCMIYQEFTLSGPAHKLSRIVFRNYYCASIKLMQQVEGEGGTAWTPLLERRLMEDPHYEDDAQDLHCVFVDELAPTFDARALGKLRFYLTQPSPSWLKFELQEVRFFAAVEDGGAGAPARALALRSRSASYASRFGFARQASAEGELYRTADFDAVDDDAPLPGSLNVSASDPLDTLELQLQHALSSVRTELLRHETLSKAHAPYTKGIGYCSAMRDSVVRVSVNPKAHVLPPPAGVHSKLAAPGGGR